MKKLIFVLLIVSTWFACCKNEEIPENVDTDYVIPVHGRFQLLFTSNPSTGLRWHWMNRSQTLSVDSVGYQFVYSKPGVPGSPGTEFWMFEGKQTGVDTLEFQYRRNLVSAEAYDTTHVVVMVK
jgi:predicted secreted protein